MLTIRRRGEPLARPEAPSQAGAVALLLECHGRIRELLAVARRLGEALDPPPAEVAAAAGRVARYFGEALPLHARDEEESVAPRLLGLDPFVDAELTAMTREHREHEPAMKSLFGWWTDRQLRRPGMPRLFDFDDAIWTRHPAPYTGLSARKVERRFRRAIEGHDLILTPNEFLAGYARQFNSRVEVIPMSLDTTQWCPQARRDDGVFRIGWAGHPMAHGHLSRIAPLLKPLLAAHPDIRLSVYSGKRPELDLPFDYVPWQAGHEHEFTAGLDVGLLPLERSEFNAGKSPIKAIQYLACGVPIVGNLFGAGAEIGDASNSLAVTQESDWAAQLECLYRDRDRCRAMGKAGREKALRQHSLQTNTPRHVDALRSLLPG